MDLPDPLSPPAFLVHCSCGVHQATIYIPQISNARSSSSDYFISYPVHSLCAIYIDTDFLWYVAILWTTKMCVNERIVFNSNTSNHSSLYKQIIYIGKIIRVK